MKITQRGFIIPLLLIIAAILLAGGGAYFYTQNKSENPPVTENITLPQATSTAPAANQTVPVTQTSTVGRLCGGGAMTNGGACPAGYLCEIVTKGPPAEGTCQVATASPTISNIEVVEGLPTGSVYAGQTAEIFGTDLRGVVSVKIGEQNVPIMTGYIADFGLDDDQAFKVPSLPAGVYNVSVTNSSMQTSNVYPVTVVVYSPKSTTSSVFPTINSISPASATAGSIVTVYGSNFNQYSFIALDGKGITASNILPNNSTSFSFTIPSNTSIGSHTVQAGARGESNGAGPNLALGNSAILNVVVSQTADGKTYSNVQYGYSFQYPSDFVRDPSGKECDSRFWGGADCFYYTGESPSTSDTVKFEVYVWTTTPEACKEIVHGGGATASAEQKTINGITFVHDELLFREGGNVNSFFSDYQTYNSGDCYLFVFVFNSNPGSNNVTVLHPEFYNKVSAELQSILSTFKFNP